jgi:hypothetical protein
MDYVRRSAWGALPPRSKPVAIATPVKHLVLHHSVTPDHGMRTVRSIQRFHQEARGWQDIAYSALWSPADQVMYEGRGWAVAGAHTRGHNRTSHAICVLGNYETTKPDARTIYALAEWANWHGTTYGPDQYVGHRDLGSSTACPGRYLYEQLGQINKLARDLNGAPPPPALELPPTLRLGDKGDDVRLLQAAVMAHDGIYGPQTERAVRDYQTAHGLTVDGICGPQTWSSILSR